MVIVAMSIKTHSIPVEFQHQIDKLSLKIKGLESLIKSKSEIPQKEYYRPAEVCQIFGISRSKFEQFKRDGLFPTHKIGGMVYVASSDLERLRPKKS